MVDQSEQRSDSVGQRSLTGPAVGISACLVAPAPGADQNRVEPPGHEVGEHALVLRLWDRLVLQEDVVVFDGDLVEVQVSCSVTPIDFQVVVSGGMRGCWVLHLRWF